jgi:hypothetical protein
MSSSAGRPPHLENVLCFLSHPAPRDQSAICRTNSPAEQLMGLS